MLADYELALMYEKKEDFESALKSYQVAYQKQEIGVLTKKMMLEKMEYFKKFVATKKNKVEEEQPTPETTKTN